MDNSEKIRINNSIHNKKLELIHNNERIDSLNEKKRKINLWNYGFISFWGTILLGNIGYFAGANVFDLGILKTLLFLLPAEALAAGLGVFIGNKAEQQLERKNNSINSEIKYLNLDKEHIKKEIIKLKKILEEDEQKLKDESIQSEEFLDELYHKANDELMDEPIIESKPKVLRMTPVDYRKN